MDEINAFRQWHRQADMPIKVNGVWQDLETGLPFRIKEWMPERPAMPHLSGSEKQISWATKIRNEHLSKISDIDTKKRLIAKHLTAKFWIDNRNLSPDEMSALA